MAGAAPSETQVPIRKWRYLPAQALRAALLWMIPAMVLLTFYQLLVYRVFAGRVAVREEAHY